MPTPKNETSNLLEQKQQNNAQSPPPKSKPLAKREAKPATVFDLIEAHKQEIAAGMPKHMPIDRLIRAFVGEFRRTPKLQQCTAESMYKCFLDMSQIGLEPGPAGLVHIIPYKNEATLQIGYKGMMALARRSGEISTFCAEVVRAKDKFCYQLGLTPSITHIPYDGDDDPGPLTHAYAVVRMKDGGYQFRVLPRREIMKAKNASPAARKGDSPWNGAFEDEMWRKTALKRTCKLCPVSTEVLNAIAIDDAYEANIASQTHYGEARSGKKTPFGFLNTSAPDEPQDAEQPKDEPEKQHGNHARIDEQNCNA